jgi:hypothetical protein
MSVLAGVDPEMESTRLVRVVEDEALRMSA